MKHLSGLIFSVSLFLLMAFVGVKVFSYQRPILPPLEERSASVLKLVSNNNLLEISATAYLVFNLKTDEVLVQKNETKVLPIASVTKLFTASVLADNFDLQATTSINWTDLNTEGEAGNLHYGEVYSYRELLFPLLLESSNDAAVALDRSSGGKTLKALNELARKTNSNDTKFTDTSGLNSSNVSTALDLKTLLTYVYKNEQPILDITKLPQYLNPKTGWINNNPISTQSGYLGGKHGYTEVANRTAVAIFSETINNEQQNIGYIILGSSNLKEDIKKLRNFVTKQ